MSIDTIPDLPDILQSDSWPEKVQTKMAESVGWENVLAPKQLNSILQSIASGEQIDAACAGKGCSNKAILFKMILNSPEITRYYIDCLRIRSIYSIPSSENDVSNLTPDPSDPATSAIELKRQTWLADFRLRMAERLAPGLWGDRKHVDITAVTSSTVRHIVDAGALDARDIGSVSGSDE